jgi:3-hydroxymyristoyl/3-hydroxydecanoyl-(acyl carrier protein) dehydratase
MRIAADHPALDGHFPGRPVVPGVVLLERTIEALRERLGGVLRVTAVPAVKFLAPLAPEQEFEIMLRIERVGQAAFEIRSGDRRLAAGSLRYETGA